MENLRLSTQEIPPELFLFDFLIGDTDRCFTEHGPNFDNIFRRWPDGAPIVIDTDLSFPEQWWRRANLPAPERLVTDATLLGSDGKLRTAEFLRRLEALTPEFVAKITHECGVPWGAINVALTRRAELPEGGEKDIPRRASLRRDKSSVEKRGIS